MVDAQAVELAVPGLGPGGGQGGHQVFGALGAHALQAGQQGPIQPVEVGDRAHQALLHQLLDQLGPQPIHIQAPLADPMAQGAPQDRRAARIDAAGGRLPLFAHQLRAALRAQVGQRQPRGPGGPQLAQHPHHLGDDLAGLAHHDRVTGVQVEFG